MGRKIFISYKYADNDVYCESLLREKTVRNYVDDLQSLLEKNDNINKGENNNESLENFVNSTIASKLRNKIYDSTLTIVMISPNMKNSQIPESEQWIPWEIAYSLKRHTRNERTSQVNALLAIVLPNKENKYNYFIEDKNCCPSGCRQFYTSNSFKILKENLFNLDNKDTRECDENSMIHYGDHSYIYSVKWSDFIKNSESYIKKAYAIQEKEDEYTLSKKV